MSLKGVIDLGSNSVRLVVYDVKEPQKNGKSAKDAKGKDGGPSTNKKYFRSILDEKKVAGLSAYVENGIFTRDGINITISVLQEHIRSAANIGCEDVHIFATAVLRNCKNSVEAARKISKSVDKDIDILGAFDEAHLGFVGATCDRHIENGTLIDIGGGSSELISIRNGTDTHGISIPQGSVSSYANFVEMILPRKDEIEAIETSFREKLRSTENLEDYRASAFFGIGGSVRALDKLYAAAFSNDNRLYVLESYQIDALRNLLETKPSTFAHAATKATPDRVHTVVPGMIIVQTLMDELGATSLSICKYGVREGYLLERVLKV